MPAGLAGDDDAEQDQGGADGAGRRQAFAEQDHRGDQCEHRIEVDVVGRRDVAELGHHQVPGHEAGEGSDKSEEQQVADHGRLAERLQGEAVAVEQEGDDRQQAVNKNLARGEERAVLLRHLAHEQAVERPAQRRRQGQQVAAQRDLQPRAVEEHHRHPGQGEDRSADQHPAATDGLHRRGETVLAHASVYDREQGRQQRRDAHEERHVAGLRVGQGRVFRQEIEGSAGDPEEDEHQFVLPGAAP